MKLRELVKATGVSRETIQFYLRDGILPKPRKKEKNQADYDESYIELIRFIKELQDNHFLPLSVIKKILKRQKKASASEERIFRLESEFFSPVDQFLAKETTGEEAFRAATGLGPKWLEKAERWGIITPDIRNGDKVYSVEDVSIGRLMVEMDRAGFGPKDGFDPEALKHFGDLLEGIMERFQHKYAEMYSEKLSPEEFMDLGNRGLDLMGLYFYLRYRKLARKGAEDYINRSKAPESGEAQ